MGDLENGLKDITSYGTTLRATTIPLLWQAFELRIRLLHLSHPTLEYLENEFKESYEKYINWEHDVELFLNVLTENPTFNAAVLGKLENYFNRVTTQRDDLRALLQQIGSLLNSHRSQAVNHTAIQIAFMAFLASIILGIVSIYVAYMSEPIIVYPVK